MGELREYVEDRAVDPDSYAYYALVRFEDAAPMMELAEQLAKRDDGVAVELMTRGVVGGRQSVKLDDVEVREATVLATEADHQVVAGAWQRWLEDTRRAKVMGVLASDSGRRDVSKLRADRELARVFGEVCDLLLEPDPAGGNSEFEPHDEAWQSNYRYRRDLVMQRFRRGLREIGRADLEELLGPGAWKTFGSLLREHRPSVRWGAPTGSRKNITLVWNIWPLDPRDFPPKTDTA